MGVTSLLVCPEIRPDRKARIFDDPINTMNVTGTMACKLDKSPRDTHIFEAERVNATVLSLVLTMRRIEYKHAAAASAASEHNDGSELVDGGRQLPRAVGGAALCIVRRTALRARFDCGRSTSCDCAECRSFQAWRERRPTFVSE
jgi:hypothetical protein